MGEQRKLVLRVYLGWRRQAATQPLNMEAVGVLLKKHLGAGAGLEALPREWGMSILNDYIVCNACSPPPVLLFVADYAQQEGAMIVDMGAFSLLTPDQLRRSAAATAPNKIVALPA